MKKNLEYYMSLPYRLEIIPDTVEDGFTASYPELPGCITFANTIEETFRNVLDAKREWIAAALEDGVPIPEPKDDTDYSGQFKLRMPKSLHRALAQHAKLEGISMNQYCNYLLTMNDAVYSERKSAVAAGR